jgi:hypothetical protein
MARRDTTSITCGGECRRSRKEGGEEEPEQRRGNGKLEETSGVTPSRHFAYPSPSLHNELSSYILV